MRVGLWIGAGLLFCQALAHAQPLASREELQRVPLEDAVILDPSGPWSPVFWPSSPHTRFAGIDLSDGIVRMVVMEPGKRHPWAWPLGIPIDPQRYPIVVMTYRASGIQPSGERLLWLDDTTGPDKGVCPFLNQDLAADGDIHEIQADLRPLMPVAEIVRMRLYPHCQGPEPAVFELLGLRFESEHDLPPPEPREEPSFAFHVVDAAGAPITGATVTVDAERVNAARQATTDADGKVTLRAANNAFDQHTVRVEKEGMAPMERNTQPGGTFLDLVRLLPGTRCAGIVQDEAGNPVPGVVLSIPDLHRGEFGARNCALLTDNEGRWQTPVVPASLSCLRLELRHPDYVCSQTTLPLAEAQAGSVLVLQRGLEIRGTVVDSNNRPVPGASVRQGVDRWNTTRSRVQTDVDGHFVFSHTPPGETVLTVQIGGFAPALVRVPLTADVSDCVIRLEPPQTIRGRVVDRDGKPLRGVRVAVRTWHNVRTISWNTMTDADGRFCWNQAPGDPVGFEVTHAQYIPLFDYCLQAADKEHEIVLLAR